LRDLLSDFYNYVHLADAAEHFDYWYSRARRCRLEPFEKLAKTLREHWDGIAVYNKNYTTSAIIENLNGRLQRARQRAYGYRNFRNFHLIAYWIAGDLTPESDLRNPFPVTF
jgi:transposase